MRLHPKGRVWVNLIGNQVVWLCAVAGAARGLQWPAVVAAAFYVVSQLVVAAEPWRELRLLAIALLCAWMVDGTAAASGTVHYAAALWGSAPPLWILALWAAFAMTLTVSMGFLTRHWALPVVFGLLLAPLAYLSAARAFKAVWFAEPVWHGVVVLGVGWAVALSVLCWVAGGRPTAGATAGRSSGAGGR
jgi:hypothetical protein